MPVEDCNNLGNFGASLGINYQLYDDLLDIFGSQSKCDKTLGTDFKARKFTLPFIRLFELVSPGERSDLTELLDQEISNDFWKIMLVIYFKSIEFLIFASLN